MQRIAVLNVVGLTESHLGNQTPNITALAEQCGVATLQPPLPAVTSTVQSTLLTGEEPNKHGIVANGWHERETKETFFWRQSNSLVECASIWDDLHEALPEATIANLFWWFNMYSSADYTVTPRPMYPADGRKIPDLWTKPNDLRDTLQNQLGKFPLFNFWGPTAGIQSSQWIAQAAKEVERKYSPTLSLVYLPHLDYSMQRVGPNHDSIAQELIAIDEVVGNLLDFYETHNVDVCLLSEYGIEEVQNAISINKMLRSSGFISIREECGREYLDAGASKAFAVPDHQIAHIYIKNVEDVKSVQALVQNMKGVEFVHNGEARGGLDHVRSGELIALAKSNSWFSHDWWFDDAKAPDYQGTVDIHRKPGYDPRELCLAKGWRGSITRMAIKLLLKKIGQRTLFDVITLDPKQVKGSHGRTPEMGAPAPILIPPACAKKIPQQIKASEFKQMCIDWISYS